MFVLALSTLAFVLGARVGCWHVRQQGSLQRLDRDVAVADYAEHAMSGWADLIEESPGVLS